MNEKIFNIGYEALTQIMELSDIILDEKLNEIQKYTLTKAIQRIAIQSKYMMFEEKEKEQ